MARQLIILWSSALGHLIYLSTLRFSESLFFCLFDKLSKGLSTSRVYIRLLTIWSTPFDESSQWERVTNLTCYHFTKLCHEQYFHNKSHTFDNNFHKLSPQSLKLKFPSTKPYLYTAFPCSVTKRGNRITTCKISKKYRSFPSSYHLILNYQTRLCVHAQILSDTNKFIKL